MKTKKKSIKMINKVQIIRNKRMISKMLMMHSNSSKKNKKLMKRKILLKNLLYQ